MSKKFDMVGKEIELTCKVLYYRSKSGHYIGTISKLGATKVYVDNSYRGGWKYPREVMVLDKNAVLDFEQRQKEND